MFVQNLVIGLCFLIAPALKTTQTDHASNRYPIMNVLVSISHKRVWLPHTSYSVHFFMAGAKDWLVVSALMEKFVTARQDFGRYWIFWPSGVLRA